MSETQNTEINEQTSKIEIEEGALTKLIEEYNFQCKLKEALKYNGVREIPFTASFKNDQKQLIVFDFDGVICVPWSRPHTYFENAVSIIKALHSQGHTLVIASFNPSAEKILKEWGLHSYFSAFRLGANHRWNGLYDEIERETMNKGKQIHNMLENELYKRRFNYIHFFDDDPENLLDVHDHIKNVRDMYHPIYCTYTYYIEPERGLDWKHVEHLVKEAEIKNKEGDELIV